MRILSMVLIGSLAAACQTARTSNTTATPESMSIEAARQVSADFKKIDFVPPPRTANDLRAQFSQLSYYAESPIPNDCSDQLMERERDFVALRDDATSLPYQFNRRISPSEWRPYGRIVKRVGHEAEVQMSAGRFDLAIELLEDTLAQFDYVDGFPVTRSTLVSKQVRIFARLGDLEKARERQKEFEQLWTHERARNLIGRSEWYSQTTSINAELAFANGELRSAEQHFRKAIVIASGFGYGSLNEADMHAGLVRTLILQGRLPEAEVASRDALESLRSTSGLRASKASAVVALALVYLEQGRPADAEFVARTAINMFEADCAAPGSLGLTAARKTLVQVLAQQKKWSDVLTEISTAKSALKGHPDLFQRELGGMLERAEAELYGGERETARRLLEKMRAAAVAEHGDNSYQVAETDALTALLFARSGNLDTAMPIFIAAIPALLEKGSSVDTIIGAAGRRGRIINGYVDTLRRFVEKGQRTVAGIDAVSEMLRVTAFHREARVGQALRAGYLRASVKDPDLADLIRQEQDISEETRAVGDILAYVSSGQAGVKAYGSSAGLQDRLETLRLARQSLRGNILERFPDFAALTTPSPMTVDAMRANLAPGQALIVFHVAEDVTYAWALPANGGDAAFALVHLARDDLADMVDELRDAVDPGILQTLSDIPRFDVDLAHKLYKRLLKPLETGWKDAKELVVVANGPLGALPFSMLVTKPGKAEDGRLLFSGYRRVAWLGRDFGVTYLPSVNSLKNFGGTGNAVAPNRPFAGFGDPYFSVGQAARALDPKAVQVASRGFTLRSAPLTRTVDSADLTALPGLPDTRDEILAVAKSLGASVARDVYLGARASEGTVKSADLSAYKVLSFATHGLVPGDLNGLGQPALALSSPSVTGEVDGDGLLTMNEILGLKLNADFAVLSACNTAAAAGEGAEAVSGLGRAFFYAGARALLVSNWPVHSGATTDLMTRLFSSLANDNGLSRTEALRQTKLQQIDKGAFQINGKAAFSYAHPIFWAPFTIIGDGGRAKVAS